MSLLRVSQKLLHCLSFASLVTLLSTSVFSSMCALIVRSGCVLLLSFCHNFTVVRLSVHAAWVSCSTRVAWWRLYVADLFWELACELAFLTSHTCLTDNTTERRSLPCDARLLHASMMLALGTPVPGRLYFLCHPVAYTAGWHRISLLHSPENQT